MIDKFGTYKQRELKQQLIGFLWMLNSTPTKKNLNYKNTNANLGKWYLKK